MPFLETIEFTTLFEETNKWLSKMIHKFEIFPVWFLLNDFPSFKVIINAEEEDNIFF